MKNNIVFKRIWAYIIDIMVIEIFVMFFTEIKFINPEYDKYEKHSNELVEILDNIETENYNDLIKFSKSKEYEQLSYKINYHSVAYSFATLGVYLLYFVGFQSWAGQTLGKKLNKIKVVDKDGKKPTITKFLLRTIIAYGLYSTFINTILIKLIPMNTYINLSSILNDIASIITLLSIVLISNKKIGVSIHDAICKTEVQEA